MSIILANNRIDCQLFFENVELCKGGRGILWLVGIVVGSFKKRYFGERN